MKKWCLPFREHFVKLKRDQTVAAECRISAEESAIIVAGLMADSTIMKIWCHAAFRKMLVKQRYTLSSLEGLEILIFFMAREARPVPVRRSPKAAVCR